MHFSRQDSWHTLINSAVKTTTRFYLFFSPQPQEASSTIISIFPYTDCSNPHLLFAGMLLAISFRFKTATRRNNYPVTYPTSSLVLEKTCLPKDLVEKFLPYSVLRWISHVHYVLESVDVLMANASPVKRQLAGTVWNLSSPGFSFAVNLCRKLPLQWPSLPEELVLWGHLIIIIIFIVACEGVGRRLLW